MGSASPSTLTVFFYSALNWSESPSVLKVDYGRRHYVVLWDSCANFALQFSVKDKGPTSPQWKYLLLGLPVVPLVPLSLRC